MISVKVDRADTVLLHDRRDELVHRPCQRNRRFSGEVVEGCASQPPVTSRTHG